MQFGQKDDAFGELQRRFEAQRVKEGMDIESLQAKWAVQEQEARRAEARGDVMRMVGYGLGTFSFICLGAAIVIAALRVWLGWGKSER